MNQEIQVIKAIIKKFKISYKSISEKSNIPISTIKKVLSGQTKNPRTDTLDAIINAVNKLYGEAKITINVDEIQLQFLIECCKDKPIEEQRRIIRAYILSHSELYESQSD